MPAWLILKLSMSYVCSSHAVNADAVGRYRRRCQKSHRDGGAHRGAFYRAPGDAFMTSDVLPDL